MSLVKDRVNNSDLCPTCVKKLRDGSQIIECDSCKQWNHLKCAKLNKTQKDTLRDTGEVEWECGTCVQGQVYQHNPPDFENLTMAQQITYIASKVAKIDTIERAVQFYSKQYEDLEKNVSSATKDISNLKKSSESMTSEIYVLKRAVKTLNDERVKNEVVIRKLQLESQPVENVVKDLFMTLQLNMNQDSYTCRAVKFNNDVSNNAVVFVKFNQFNDKNALMHAKKNLRNIAKFKEVMIFDVLGPETMDVFNYAKNLQKYGFPVVYSSGGKVFVKARKEDRPTLIKNKDHIDDLIKRAVSGGASGSS